MRKNLSSQPLEILFGFLILLGWTTLVYAQQPVKIWTGHTGAVGSIGFIKDGNLLVSGGLDGTVRLWELPTGKEVKALGNRSGPVYSFASGPGAVTLVVGTGDPESKVTKISLVPPTVQTRVTPPRGSVTLWDVTTGDQTTSFTTGTHVPSILVLTQGGKTLLSGGLDGTVRLWDLASRRERDSYQGPPGEEVFVAIASNGSSFGWGSPNGEIRCLDVTSGKRWAARHGRNLVSLGFSPDGKILCSGDMDIKLWNAQTGKELVTLGAHHAGIFALGFTPDGRMLASGSGLWKSGAFYGGEIRLWDVKSHKQMATLRGHSGHVSSLAVSPDGRLLASGSTDGTIALWAIPSPDRDGR